ncbi:MAG: hypothetical protein LBD11_03200 [Candidatus Peribacteria bacterium]|nr:hypothetical protein [Candidatus Peribacteria bacterium]
MPEYNLFTYKGKTSAERMLHCIEYHQAQNSSTTKKEKMQTIVADYSAQAWYQHFLALFISASTSSHSSPQKIVLVSDFINKIGGIETYLHDVKALLESQGHQVMLRGGDLPKGIWGRITMRLGLITAPLNFWSAKKFKKFLQTEKPDIIWFNSLLRHLGGNVVKVATSFQQNAPSSSPKIWMMYHDLGYFTPYPSRVSAITEIKTPLNLQHFLA